MLYLVSCFDIDNSGYGGDLYPQWVKLGRWEDMVWEEEVERVEGGARPGWGWITLFYRSEARITSYINRQLRLQVGSSIK